MHGPVDRLNDALSDRYLIERELGEGGMATVYLARDRKHDRQVAIKVLRRELAAVLGAERFLAEIRTTANLQHPHILPLFDSGEADGFLYYVMPYVEGESLRERLDCEQQLPVDEAVGIARDVADALDYAHRAGVIHRDIKPANILLHEGRPLVADFGIALAVSAAGAGRMTETGLSLGTPYYMSPEQASAERDLTARSDVYSLGCVLYEMLAGQPPHTGPTTQSVLMRILTEDPRPLLELRRTAPTHVAAAVMKAIEKLPADRFATAAELRTALDDRSFTWTAPQRAATGAAVPPAPRVDGRTRASRWAPWGLAAVLGALAVWFAIDAPREATLPAVGFEVDDSSGVFVGARVASNGAIVWRGVDGIHVRPPDLQASPAVIDVGDWEVRDFDISPQGDAVILSTDDPGGRSLIRFSADGTRRETLWPDPVGRPDELFWGEDGWIYFARDTPAGNTLSRIPDSGGESEDLLLSEATNLMPLDLLPDATGLLYHELSGGDTEGFTGWIGVLDVATGDTTLILPDAWSASWSPTGHLVYEHASGALWARPFDARSHRFTGPANPVQPGVATRFPGRRRFDLSRSGTLAYLAGPPVAAGSGDRFILTLMDVTGATDTLPLAPTNHADARLSPHGTRLAFTRDQELWVFDLDLGTLTPISRGTGQRHNPVWSPDGLQIAFSMPDTTGDRIVRRDADGSGDRTDVIPYRNPQLQQWLEDGTLLFSASSLSIPAPGGGPNNDILAVPAEGGGAATPVLNAAWYEGHGRVSPDGRWLAYISGRSGTTQVYVRSWPDRQNELVVSEERPDVVVFSGAPLMWSSDSRVIYYQEIDRAQAELEWLVAAARLDPGTPARVEDRRVVLSLGQGLLRDLSPDGRFLVMQPAPDGSDSRRGLIVVTNWFTRLRERMAP